MIEWISINTRMPEANIKVLIATSRDNVYMGEKLEDGDGDEWMYCDTYLGVDEDITHWMPLPEPPK